MRKIAENTISMALEVTEEHNKQTAEYNLSKGRAADHMFYDAEDLFAMYKTPTPKRDALRFYLDSLGDEILRDLVALMYSGRGDDDYAVMRDHVKEWDHNGCVMKLVEKAPLATYLQKGLERI